MTGEILSKIDNEFSKYPMRKYGKGQILIYADEEVKSITLQQIIVDNEYDITYRGDEVVLNLFRPNSFFPMSNVINNVKSKYFYRTESDTEVHVVPAADAIKFVKSNPDVLLDLLSRVYRGADVLLDRLANSMAGTAKFRIVYEIVNEARREGFDGKENEVKLSINEQDLAARTGFSRETISREFKSLKNEKLVEVTRHSITIKSLPKLQEIIN